MKIAATFLLLIGLMHFVKAQPAATSGPQLFRIVKQGKVGFIDETGKTVIKPVFEAAGQFSEGLAPARLNGLYGFIDRKGTFVIRPQFDFAEGFQENMAIVYQQGKPFYINRSGRKPFETPFAELENFRNGIAQVRTATNKTGIINKQGRLVIDTVFRYVFPLDNGTALVTGLKHEPYPMPPTNPKTFELGVVDTLGKFLIPFGQYSEINVIENGYFLAQIPEETQTGSRNYALLNPQGQLVAALKTNSLPYPKNNHDSVVAILKNKIPGTVQAQPTILGYAADRQTIQKLQTITGFTEFYKVAPNHFVARNQQYIYSLIDKNGKIYPTSTFSFDPYAISPGQPFLVRTKAGYGLMDTTGQFVLEPQFDYVDYQFTSAWDGIGTRQPPPDYFFYIKNPNQVRNALYGIATKNGQILTPPLFQEYDQTGFQNGLLKVAIDNRLTYLNRQGKIVWQENKPRANSRLNLDHKFFHPFRGDSQVKPASVKPKYSDVNYQHPVQRKKDFPQNMLSIVAKPGKSAAFQERFKGFTVLVSNTTTRDVRFNSQDYRLDMAMQAQDTEGQWHDISYLSPSMCGNSYAAVTLKQGNYWEFVAPVLEGSQKTKMRFRLTYQDPETKTGNVIYSNEFPGKVNPGQLWRQKEVSGLYSLPYLF